MTSITSWNPVHNDVGADGDYTAADISSIHNVYTTRTLTEELRLNYDGERLSGLLGG